MTTTMRSERNREVAHRIFFPNNRYMSVPKLSKHKRLESLESTFTRAPVDQVAAGCMPCRAAKEPCAHSS